MDEESGEAAGPHTQHHADTGAVASNTPAITSLVLGVLALVIQLLGWGAGGGFGAEEVVVIVIAMALGISAIVFGRRGKRVAEAEGQGRVTATMGLVLGIVCVAVPILGLLAFIAWIGCCLKAGYT
jgi:hypothetical protein